MHRKCWAAHASSRRSVRHQLAAPEEPQDHLHYDLPSLEDVCAAQVMTCEFLEPSLLAIAESEFLKCLDNVMAQTARMHGHLARDVQISLSGSAADRR